VDHYEELHTQRALVVDDDPVICEGLGMALEDEGFEVTMRMRGTDVLEQFAELKPDIAFIDVVMNDMDGLDLSAELKALKPSLDIVVISASPNSGNILRAMQLGAYDFLFKPFHPDDLKLCLTRYHERLGMRRRVELAESRHEMLIQNIPLFIFRLREDFSLDFANRACSSMLGYTPAEAMVQENWFLSRVRLRDRARVRNVLTNAFASPYPLTVQCRLLHRRGFDVHGILKTLPSASAEGSRMLDSVFVDISQRVYEEQSRVQEARLKTIGAISQEVAHEIRNPLMSIGGFARRLSAKAPDFPETEIILRESKRLEHLLDRIKGYLEAPAAVERKRVCLETVLTGQLESMEADLKAQGITLDTACEPGLPEAVADPALLARAFGILLGDAAHALDRGGTLRIRLSDAGETVNSSFDYELSKLKDIDPERIYLPYEDGGYGLPNCYRLVEQMGGVLSMTREDGRVVFTLALPKAKARARS